MSVSSETSGHGSDGGFARSLRRPLTWVVAAVALVPLVTAELNSLGFEHARLLYDAVALPRLILAVALVLAAWVAWTAARGTRSMRVHPVLALLGAVSVLAAISTVVSADTRLSVLGQSERLEGLVAWCLYPLLVGAGMMAVEHTKDLRWLARGLAASSAVAATHGILQFAGVLRYANVGGGFTFDERRAFATFENPNFLAGLLVLALPLAIGLTLSERDVRWRGFAAGSAILIGAALVATMTRGAWLAALAELVLLAILLVRRRRLSARTWTVVILVVLVVVLAVGALSITRRGEANLVERVAEWSSLNERLVLWQVAAEAALDRPLLGWGPDNFMAAFRAHRSPEYVAVSGPTPTLNNAHSWPLQTAATLGIPAALLLVLAVGWALAAGGKVCLSREGGRGDFVYAGAWIGCLGFTLHLLANVTVSGVTTPFLIMLGATLAPVAGTWSTGHLGLGWRALPVVVLAAAMVAGGFALAADGVYWRSRLIYQGEVQGDAVASSALALRMNPTSVKYARGHAQALAQRFYDNAQSSPSTAPLDAANQAFRAVERVHPTDYPARAWHAALLADGARLFSDEALAREAGAVAEAAMELDRQAEQVAAIATGSIEPSATLLARSVAGLP